MIKNVIIFLLFLLFTGGCCGSNAISGESAAQPLYKKIAEEKFNSEYKTFFNNDSSFLIVCYSPDNASKGNFQPLNFFVYEPKEKKIIFQENLANGKVEWINDHQLKVSTFPEIIKGNNEDDKQISGYVYDVFARKKISRIDRSK